VEAHEDQELDRTQIYIKSLNSHALVIDTYSAQGYALAQVHAQCVAVIDDLANRPLPVDVVINGSVNASELTYVTSPQTQLLLGPKYLLLRDEFSQELSRWIRDRVERVLITVGGVDSFGLTSRLIAWTREAIGKVNLDVVLGPFFTQESLLRIEEVVAGDYAVTVHRDPQYLRDLMLSCDLAITGGGQTVYELAATGTPCIAIKLAENQSLNLIGLSAKGALLWAGDVRDRDLDDKVIKSLRDISVNKPLRDAMSQCGRSLVDGGGAVRVAQTLLQLCCSSK